nr:hypothetical protein [Tanacetum cinerariifolium]
MNSGDDVRSGGKTVKKRRLATGKTPYDRPEPPQDKEQEKEKGNWIKYVTGEGGIEDDMVDNENLPDGDVELNQRQACIIPSEVLLLSAPFNHPKISTLTLEHLLAHCTSMILASHYRLTQADP